VLYEVVEFLFMYFRSIKEILRNLSFFMLLKTDLSVFVIFSAKHNS